MATDWMNTTLGELLDMSGGSIKTGPFGTKLKASEYTASGVPVISVAEVGDGRLRVREHTPRVDESVTSRMQEYLLTAGDIVFGRKGAVERSAQVQPYESGYFLGSDGIRVRLDDQKTDPRFIAFQFQTREHKAWMIQHASGSTMPSLNEGIIRRVPIRLTSLANQTAIASILGALDDKIELNRRMNATLEAMARALFQSWFVDFDPVRAKLDGRQPAGLDAETVKLFPNSFDHSSSVALPKGWRVGRLCELAIDEPQAIAGGPFGSNLTRKHYVESGVPVIRGANMSGGSGWFNDQEFVFVSEEKAESLQTNVARPGDVLFTQRGTLGQVALIPEDAKYPRFIISQSQMKMTCAAGVPAAYIYLLFSQPTTVAYILANATSSGVPHVNLSFLREFPILIPLRAVLAAFGRIVGPLVKSINANARESRILVALRDILLPKLLSGELRIPSPLP